MQSDCETKDFSSEICHCSGVVHTLCKKTILLRCVKAAETAGGLS